jgi:hypothetical protein
MGDHDSYCDSSFLAEIVRLLTLSYPHSAMTKRAAVVRSFPRAATVRRMYARRPRGRGSPRRRKPHPMAACHSTARSRHLLPL